MSFEQPLYFPCFAAHSPKRLEKIVASEIAKILVMNSIPYELKSSKENPNHYNSLCCSKLDEVLLGTPENMELHKLLKERFRVMKIWWEKSLWFGGFGSPLRKVIQEGVSHLLDHIDYYAHCPLFRFTCQLCYTREAGVFNQNNTEIIVQIPRRHCNQYASLLKYLGTFQIEHLLNTCMLFGNPNPLIIILKNVPFLKSIHMRYNSCDYTVGHVGRYCPNLESFIIEDFLGTMCVSETYLYKTFFCGCQKEEVIASLASRDDVIPPKLSFPKLTQIDVGKCQIVQEFYCIMNYYYPNLKSLSCNSFNLSAMYLLKASAFITGKFIPFNVEDLCLKSDCLINLDENVFVKYFPKVKHITLLMDSVPESQINVFKQKVRTFLTKINFFSLSVRLPFDSIGDESLEEVLVPLFSVIGGNVRFLQFFFMREIDVYFVWTLVNSCPNLELLGFRIHVDSTFRKTRRFRSVKLSPLIRLKSFSVSFEESNTVENFLVLMEEVVEKAPNIVSLELMLPGVASTWILNVVAKGLLKHVCTLIFHMHFPLDLILDIDFYVVVVEALTALERLVLIGVPPAILSHMKKVFNTSQLQIIPGKRKSCISYSGLHSKYVLQ